MTHYICTGGCGGVAESPGTCQAQECDRCGEPLAACECTDGMHEPIEESSEKSEDEEE